MNDIKNVLSISNDIVKMDSTIFKGDFDKQFSTIVLNKISEYASMYKQNQKFEAKSGPILVNVLFCGMKLGWDENFCELLLNSI